MSFLYAIILFNRSASDELTGIMQKPAANRPYSCKPPPKVADRLTFPLEDPAQRGNLTDPTTRKSSVDYKAGTSRLDTSCPYCPTSNAVRQ